MEGGVFFWFRGCLVVARARARMLDATRGETHWGNRRSSPPEHTKCEIEVLLEPTASGRELVCRAVLDLQSSEKLKFNKARFSTLVHAHESTTEWPELKITKRGV